MADGRCCGQVLAHGREACAAAGGGGASGEGALLVKLCVTNEEASALIGKQVRPPLPARGESHGGWYSQPPVLLVNHIAASSKLSIRLLLASLSPHCRQHTHARSRAHMHAHTACAPLPPPLSLPPQGSVIRDVRLGLGGAPNCFRVAERDPANPAVRVVTFTGSFALAQQAHEVKALPGYM